MDQTVKTSIDLLAKGFLLQFSGLKSLEDSLHKLLQRQQQLSSVLLDSMLDTEVKGVSLMVRKG